jgi:hypothetical protein
MTYDRQNDVQNLSDGFQAGSDQAAQGRGSRIAAGARAWCFA